MEKTNLKFDNERWHSDNLPLTGIMVRAINPDGIWDNEDIVFLDKPSLLAFLRTRGEENAWVENIVGLMLGHGRLND